MPHTTAAPGATDARLITIQGRIDAAKVIALEQQLAGTQRIRRIVLDLSEASGVPPRTLTMLRGALRRVLRGGALAPMIVSDAPVRSASDAPPWSIRRIVLDLSDATGVPPRTLTMLRGALRRMRSVPAS